MRCRWASPRSSSTRTSYSSAASPTKATACSSSSSTSARRWRSPTSCRCWCGAGLSLPANRLNSKAATSSPTTSAPKSASWPRSGSFPLTRRTRGALMPKYLSEEWHKEFQRLWNDLLPDRPGTSARTQNKITGGPAGDQAYYWVIRDGKLSEAMVGESPDSEVTITTGYVDSVKIQKGELDPNAAFMQGRMKVSGNVAKLMALLPVTNSPEYKQLQEQVRAMSEF